MRRVSYIMGALLEGICPKGSGTGWTGTLIWAFRIALAGNNVRGSSQVTRLNSWIVAGADDHCERVSKPPDPDESDGFLCTDCLDPA